VFNLPTKILCDTNFLLLPLRFGVDVFNEVNDVLNDIVEFYVSSKVLNEINLLRKKAKPRLNKELLFALKMTEQCKIIQDDSKLLVDDSLVELAKKNFMVIGTTDSRLRKKARAEGIRVIYLRQKRYLVLEG
jgi:rRNA-processing protein FCF1